MLYGVNLLLTSHVKESGQRMGINFDSFDLAAKASSATRPIAGSSRVRGVAVWSNNGKLFQFPGNTSRFSIVSFGAKAVYGVEY
jgi:hypothetical protein